MPIKEQRRYPKRYSTQVPVTFLDKAGVKGMLTNLSRDGILVTAPKLKSINAFVRLVVFLPGIENGVTITGKVVRHTVVNDVQAMGIQFLELDATDRDVWLNYISNFTRNAQHMLDSMVLSEEESMNIEPFKGSESTFILKFKSTERMEEFFPQDLKNEDFFIRTTIKKNKGDKVILRLFNPSTEEELKLDMVVRKYDRHPIKVHKEGLFLVIHGFNPKIEAKICKFLNIEKYT